MFGKSMFYRMLKTMKGDAANTSLWEVTRDDTLPVIPHGDAATIPLYTYDATEEIRVNEISETTLIPVFRPAAHDNAVVHRIETSKFEVEAVCKAAEALLMGDINTVLAGLYRYVERQEEIERQEAAKRQPVAA